MMTDADIYRLTGLDFSNPTFQDPVQARIFATNQLALFEAQLSDPQSRATTQAGGLVLAEAGADWLRGYLGLSRPALGEDASALAGNQAGQSVLAGTGYGLASSAAAPSSRLLLVGAAALALFFILRRN